MSIISQVSACIWWWLCAWRLRTRRFLLSLPVD